MPTKTTESPAAERPHTMQADREEFLNSLEHISPGLSPKEIIEQSSCFVFHRGRIITFNGEIACSVRSPIKVEGAVPAEPLLDLLRKMSEDRIEIEQKKDHLLIKGSKDKQAGIRLQKEIMLPYATIEKPSEWKKLHRSFCDAVMDVVQCVSNDITRYKLCCIHITSKFMESCDNFQGIRYPLKTGINDDIMVLGNCMRAVALANVSEYSIAESWIHFKNEMGFNIACKLPPREDYPDIASQMEFSGDRVVLPKGLPEVIGCAEIFSSQNVDNSKLMITLVEKKMHIQGDGAAGWFHGWKPIKYNGPETTFLISPKILTDVMSRQNECEIGENKLKIETHQYTYVTMLGRPPEKQMERRQEDHNTKDGSGRKSGRAAKKSRGKSKSL